MRNKVVTLTNEVGLETFLNCNRVYESIDRKIVLEIDQENRAERLWWFIDIADRYEAEYEYSQENNRIILAVKPEMITEMYSY